MKRAISDRFPFVEIAWEVRGQSGQILAFIDTGFDGYLMLPSEWLYQFGMPDTLDWWQLADGSIVVTPVYEGFASIKGIDEHLPVKVIVMGDEVIVGLKFLCHYLVILERGQRVIVEP